MAINLVTKFLPYVDEMFTKESRRELLTNKDFSWDGAKTVKVYKIGTSQMNDYDRAGESETNWSRYGEVTGLDADNETFTLVKDRSFTFAIDKLDADETGKTLQAASALARQIREVVIPEIDTYIYGKMCAGAGTKPEAIELTAANIGKQIMAASAALDNAEVPETKRVLVVTPNTYLLMKQCPDIVLNTEVGQDMRLKGVIANMDGATVVKVSANRVPEAFGFMLAHPCACVAPEKLTDYKIHENPPGISGSLVEGRLCYDAFILDNKKKAIYYQAAAAAESQEQENDQEPGNGEG